MKLEMKRTEHGRLSHVVLPSGQDTALCGTTGLSVVDDHRYGKACKKCRAYVREWSATLRQYE